MFASMITSRLYQSIVWISVHDDAVDCTVARSVCRLVIGARAVYVVKAFPYGVWHYTTCSHPSVESRLQWFDISYRVDRSRSYNREVKYVERQGLQEQGGKEGLSGLTFELRGESRRGRPRRTESEKSIEIIMRLFKACFSSSWDRILKMHSVKRATGAHLSTERLFSRH